MNMIERMDALKNESGLKNAEIARIAGVSKQAVGGWANEGKIPSIEAAQKIRKELGISEDWLRHGIGPMKVACISEADLPSYLESALSSINSDEERRSAAAEALKVISKFIS